MFEKLQQLLRGQPFEPFEVRLSNGETHKVSHPECAALTPFVLVVTDLQSGKIVECALHHVACVERLPAAETPTSQPDEA